MNAVNTPSTSRSRTGPYHHGNLREELVRIGVELAAEGGPEAIGIREASRRAGVSAAAAYRHFAGQEELREAVRRTAAARLATHVAEDMARLADDAPSADRLLALGRAYIGFARAEPQLFRCLTSGFAMPDGDDEDPFTQLLSDVAHMTGRDDDRDEEQLADAVALLSSAHGFATLAINGVLRDMAEDRLRGLRERTLAVAIAGLEQIRARP